jgi:hypothetical protein
MGDTFQYIRELQFEDKGRAETLLLGFMQANYPFDIVSVELRPLAVSLNSFNGFLTLRDGTRLFFKTHTESDTLIHEYYNADLLANAGYPIIRPIYKSQEVGKQILIYNLIEDRSVFDIAWDLENDQPAAAIEQAQYAADQLLYELYEKTLVHQSAEESARAPIHQLFSHRLTAGRLDRFYGPLTRLVLPAPRTDVIRMSEVRQKRWVVNGQHYDETLDDLIRRAIDLLDPEQAGPAVVGHGDAHNGNVFFHPNNTPQKGELVYFDPAFAGTHHPLLDLTKPLFHNVFAMWMYHPKEIKERTTVTLGEEGDTWHIDYDYRLPPIRQIFLDSKIKGLLQPTLKLLKDRGMLREDWRTFLKTALFCCPFLTMNLTDDVRFPPEISLLGLAMSIEMGGESKGKRSVIDTWLDYVAL